MYTQYYPLVNLAELCLNSTIPFAFIKIWTTRNLVKFGLKSTNLKLPLYGCQKIYYPCTIN